MFCGPLSFRGAEVFNRPEESAPKIGIKSFAFSSACAGSRRPFSCRGVSQGDMNDCFVFRQRAQKQILRFAQNDSAETFFSKLLENGLKFVQLILGVTRR